MVLEEARKPIQACVVLAAAFALLATSARGARAEDPLPLTAATGYRDYCDGMSVRQQRRICGHGAVPEALWRPLKLRVLAARQHCPVSRRHSIVGSLRGIGTGPVYSTHITPWHVPFPPSDRSVAAGTGWSADKTPLVWRKRLQGPLLVRGARIDAVGEVGFSGPAGRRPFAAVQFARGRRGLETAGLSGWAVVVWLKAPGCYALQIDAPRSSRVMVFRVRAAAS